MIDIEPSSGNVFEDLRVVDAQGMAIKARLTGKIAEIIRHRHLTQGQAAEILDMPEPNLADLLRGRFRDISEARLMGCLNRLGQNVEIVIRKAPRRQAQGQTQVVCD